MKVYISTDLEGVAGVINFDDWALNWTISKETHPSSVIAVMNMGHNPKVMKRPE